VIKHLYIKETKCGLRYLGITKRNPYKYKGSGKYWVKYLKSNNINSGDIYTNVIFSGEDNEYFYELCEFVSDELDIVNSRSFANLIIESGRSLVVSTPEISEAKRVKMKNRWKDKNYRSSMTGKNHPMYGVERLDTKERNIERFKNKEEREKISESSKRLWSDKKHREKMSNLFSGDNNPAKRKDVAKKISETKKRKFKSGELISSRIKTCMSPSGKIYKSVKEASIDTCLPYYNVQRYCLKQTNGWKYVTE